MDRRWLWLLAAALLVIAAAWLVRIPEAHAPLARPEVEMPRQLRPEERRRMLARLRPPVSDAGVHRNEVRDPMLAALSAGGGGSGVVLEVNALRNSPLGELLLQCLAGREGRGNALEALQRMGIDPLRDVDRVGITEHGIVVSGDFRRANWEGLLGSATGAPYGEHGQITAVDPRAEGGGTLVATRWGDSLLHLGDSAEDGRRIVDAVEGRGPEPRPLLSPEQSYGELYGVVSGADLARTLGGSEPWAAALVEAASRVEVHLDARRDVALVADVSGEDARKLEDLGKTLGGALALARAQARAQGDDDAAELLGFARVSPAHGNALSLEVALPLEAVAKRLTFCRWDADAGR
ncbi:MAG TPA: hypothetical protein VFD38_10925 [Myxococcaceae bacterium]|nr:hypothetical protein [Myxococcaceae bacterium]